MRIVIFHFNPLEKFPPVMNFIRVLETRLTEKDKVVVFTTRTLPGIELFQRRNQQLQIRRFGLNTIHMNSLHRYFNYLRYWIGTLFYCLFSVPDKIFYYESMSALIPFVLKRYFFRKVPLFIHYHEYMSEKDYKGMYLSSLFHRKERKMYPFASWISHTNKERMQLFLEDIGSSDWSNKHIYPNYPLKEWGKYKEKEGINSPVKLLYVGSFGSMESLYIREILEWVKEQRGTATLDIYSFDVPADIRNYLNGLNCSFIQTFGAVSYFQLPGIISKYDVGLILYKGVSENFIYNAPNKLFEYLACGLDTWYPAAMKGLWEYDSPMDWPKVMRLDFENLSQYNINELVCRKTATRRPINYSCEASSKELLEKLIYEK